MKKQFSHVFRGVPCSASDFIKYMSGEKKLKKPTRTIISNPRRFGLSSLAKKARKIAEPKLSKKTLNKAVELLKGGVKSANIIERIKNATEKDRPLAIRVDGNTQKIKEVAKVFDILDIRMRSGHIVSKYFEFIACQRNVHYITFNTSGNQLVGYQDVLVTQLAEVIRYEDFIKDYEEYIKSEKKQSISSKRHTYEKVYKREDGVIFEKDSIIEPGFDKLTIEQLIKLEQDLVKKARKIRGLLNSHRSLKF